eukprot:1148881-Pelagomonas_calceolata.AAC.18
MGMLRSRLSLRTPSKVSSEVITFSKLSTMQDLPKQVMRNVSTFRLHALTFKVELAVWQDGTSVSDRCSFNQLKMKHTFFLTALMNKFILCAKSIT